MTAENDRWQHAMSSGNTYVRSGEYSSAVAQFDTAYGLAQTSDDQIESLLSAALALCAAGRLDEAERRLKVADNADVKDSFKSRSAMIRALLLRRRGERVKSSDVLQSELEDEPQLGVSSICECLAINAFAMGEYAESVALFDKFMSLTGKSFLVNVVSYAKALLQEEQRDKAEQVLIIAESCHGSKRVRERCRSLLRELEGRD